MPYPAPFSQEEQLTIEDAIREGLRRAFLCNPTCLQSPLQEVPITVALEDELASMLEDESEPVPGFTSEVFELARGTELRDARSEGLENRPDLQFRRKKRPRRGMDFRQFGLFVECKVVDASRVMHPYVQDGLRRIADGTYAWAVPIALMVAYVDGNYSLPQTLTEYLRDQPVADPVVSAVSLRDEPPAAIIYSTVHVRAFQYKDGGVPGPVQVDHLWHNIHRSPVPVQLDLFGPGRGSSKTPALAPPAAPTTSDPVPAEGRAGTDRAAPSGAGSPAGERGRARASAAGAPARRGVDGVDPRVK